MPIDLLLIRHGETSHNANRRWQGQLDEPLSARGYEQARQLAQRLATQPPSVLYASDLSRAFDTARAIAESCNLPIHPEPRLRESHIGMLEGLPHEEIVANYPEEWARVRSGDPHHRRGGGETALEVQLRMVAAMEEISARHVGERVALVSHGFALSTYLYHLLGVPLGQAKATLRFDNTSITHIHFREEGLPVVLYLNDTRHLEGHP